MPRADLRRGKANSVHFRAPGLGLYGNLDAGIREAPRSQLNKTPASKAHLNPCKPCDPDDQFLLWPFRVSCFGGSE